MTRRKLTLEVITKSLATFLFGVAVGYGSFQLTGLIISRTAFAENEAAADTLESFPKTLSDIDFPDASSATYATKPAGTSAILTYSAQIIRPSAPVEESPAPAPSPEALEPSEISPDSATKNSEDSPPSALSESSTK